MMYGHTKRYANKNRYYIDCADVTFYIINKLDLPRLLSSRVDEIKIIEGK
jgi:hypothetical protein